MTYAFLRVAVIFSISAPSLLPQAAGLGQGWLPEFNLAARQTLEIAEAIPSDKYAWRPGPGVRSVAQVFIHTIQANLGLLRQAGVQPSVDFSTVPAEAAALDKAEVIKWLKASFEAVRVSYPTADLKKKIQFLKRDSSVDSVFLRILVHNHEHMGQSIAYARMLGVAPPWSK
ncbi:MAG: DinB family protein [Bryobacteraceae bacterium]|nr:DinB family protein [Bryobacteraceae bacterium]